MASIVSPEAIIYLLMSAELLLEEQNGRIYLILTVTKWPIKVWETTHHFIYLHYVVAMLVIEGRFI